MKLPLSWLRDWIEVDGNPEQIADALTRSGFYVEGIESHGRSYPGVVVARVLEVARHPNADRLSLCRVDSGAGELSVVCGAPNVHAGMIAPLATIGSTLPGGTVIRASKIRGQESQGMLCSARELEMSEDHEGILDLGAIGNGTAAGMIGRPLDDLLGPPEEVLEVEIPFNRPDGLGIVGLAREVKAALNGRWTADAQKHRAARWSGPADFDLELEDSEGCPHYIAQVIEGVRVEPSPPWLRKRIESAGQRSINTLVDLSNFVLFELGQPIHVFDLDRLEGPAIRVRRARPGERLTTLDGRERALDPEMLVIADRHKPVAVAGVMGGADSEVTDGTTRILLECAWFEPRRVRRGARALGLATEASRRYERAVDRGIASAAAARFIELLREVCPGIRLGPARDVDLDPPAPRIIAFRPARGTRLTGLPVTAPLAWERLARLEFEVAAGDPLRVTVPSWRVDVTIEDDLVEEVARSIGYDQIPEVPLETAGAHATRSAEERVVARARDAMRARGLSEAWCTTLISEREALQTVGLIGGEADRMVRLRNATSREGEVLRPNLVAGLLRACAHNLRQGSAAVRLFEIGTGFQWTGARSESDPARAGELPVETMMLAAIVTGSGLAHAHGDDTTSAKDSSLRPLDFLDAKGLWEAWLDEMRVDSPTWQPYAADGWKTGASAEVASATSRIGWAGTLSQPLLRGWEIETPVHLFVAPLEPFLDMLSSRRLSLPGRFPPVRRDVAFFVPDAVTHQELAQSLTAAAGEWLHSIELFDVYAGPGTPQGMKSMAYALQFQHPERTMTESEIQATQDRMTKAVTSRHAGQLREK